MSFVGAANSPCGSSITRQGNNAPDQFDTKMNKKTVPKYGTHFKYSSSPICVFAKSRINSVTNSVKFCNPSGVDFKLLFAAKDKMKIRPKTNQDINKTC